MARRARLTLVRRKRPDVCASVRRLQFKRRILAWPTSRPAPQARAHQGLPILCPHTPRLRSVDFSQLGNALQIEAGNGFGATLFAARMEAVGDNPTCPN